ncbi:MAG: DUF3450 domain-containing protein [Thermincolia bacterium]
MRKEWSRVEEVLKQILGELKSFNKRVDSLEKGQQDLMIEFKTVNTRLDNFEKRFENVENRLENLENKMEAVYEQTAGLIEYRTVSLTRLEKIESDIEILAGETGKQKLEIERLKKQAI